MEKLSINEKKEIPMNVQKVRVWKFIDKDGYCIVIGLGLGCSKLTMIEKIIPEIWNDFPSLPDTEAYLVVLLGIGETKGSEPVVGSGLKFVPPGGVAVPNSYIPLPIKYTQRGESPSGDETFSLWKSEKDRLTFYMRDAKGCSLAGLKTLFERQEKEFPNVTANACFIVVFY
jgi:hypothetical protein